MRLHPLPPEFRGRIEYLWYIERIQQMGSANLYDKDLGWKPESHDCFRFLAQWKEKKLPFRLLRWKKIQTW